ncbi:MAG: hypothetical protein JXQ71_09200 [Verrucomicrobia bacterium]|nr:hypothetical protein [Verrucomicrobiota bacterium]
MKKALLSAVILLGALVAFGPLAQAAEKAVEGRSEKSKGRTEGRADRIEMMTKELNLNESQVEKLKAVQQENMTKMREMRKDTSLTREQRNEKMRALMEGYQAKLKAILTPEQSEKWQKLNAQRMQKRKKQ